MAVRDTIYIGTDDARMLRLTAGSNQPDPLPGFDHVPGRETWFAGSAIINGQRMGPPLGIRSLAANADDTVLFANVHVGGIPRSLDGGQTWHPTIDIHADVHEVRAHPSDPHLVAAASAIGLCLSRDAGATWTVEHEGLHAPHCAAVAFSGADILVSAATDPFTDQGKIYRRPFAPDPHSTHAAITPVEGGLPTWTSGIADTSCIATQGSTAVIVDKSGTLYRSLHFGRAWSPSSIPLPAPSSVLLC